MPSTPTEMTADRRAELRTELEKPWALETDGAITAKEIRTLLAAADRVEALETAMRSAVQALTVPAAEYVPAMPEAWGILLEALGE